MRLADMCQCPVSLGNYVSKVGGQPPNLRFWEQDSTRMRWYSSAFNKHLLVPNYMPSPSPATQAETVSSRLQGDKQETHQQALSHSCNVISQGQTWCMKQQSWLGKSSQKVTWQESRGRQGLQVVVTAQTAGIAASVTWTRKTQAFRKEQILHSKRLRGGRAIWNRSHSLGF